MKSLHISSVTTIKNYLDCLIKAGRYDQAEATFESEIQGLDSTLASTETISTLSHALIKGFSKCGSLERAMKVYESHSPLSISYVLNLFLEALIKHDQHSNAFTIFSAHLDYQKEGRHVTDGQTFALIAKSFIQQGKPTEAFELST